MGCSKVKGLEYLIVKRGGENMREKTKDHRQRFDGLALSFFAFIVLSFQLLMRMVLLGGIVLLGSICFVIPLFLTNQALLMTSGERSNLKPVKNEGG